MAITFHGPSLSQPVQPGQPCKLQLMAGSHISINQFGARRGGARWRSWPRLCRNTARQYYLKLRGCNRGGSACGGVKIDTASAWRRRHGPCCEESLQPAEKSLFSRSVRLAHINGLRGISGIWLACVLFYCLI